MTRWKREFKKKYGRSTTGQERRRAQWRRLCKRRLNNVGVGLPSGISDRALGMCYRMFFAETPVKKERAKMVLIRELVKNFTCPFPVTFPGFSIQYNPSEKPEH